MKIVAGGVEPRPLAKALQSEMRLRRRSIIVLECGAGQPLGAMGRFLLMEPSLEAMTI